jgi:uncharacterized protein YecE (DUF72 family)
MVVVAQGRVLLGIAGWSVPSAFRSTESSGQSLLGQYAGLFPAVEINTSFYRPHRPATYERWGASVPDQFRFAVKVPKLITHEHGLADCHEEILAFAGAVRGLHRKLGVLLVQLPPSLEFDAHVARNFFRTLKLETAARIACEPRNSTWFTRAADDVFEEFGLARVSADPAPAGCGFRESPTAKFEYLRLHGAPRIYHSAYAPAYLERLASAIGARPPAFETWCIFDNTASGAAWSNASALLSLLKTQSYDRPRGCRRKD